MAPGDHAPVRWRRTKPPERVLPDRVLVLADPMSTTVTSLHGLAAALWAALETPRSASEALGVIAEFIEHPLAVEDVEAMLNELQQLGLVGSEE